MFSDIYNFMYCEEPSLIKVNNLIVNSATVRDCDILLLRHYVRKLSVSITELVDGEHILHAMTRLNSQAASH